MQLLIIALLASIISADYIHTKYRRTSCSGNIFYEQVSDSVCRFPGCRISEPSLNLYGTVACNFHQILKECKLNIMVTLVEETFMKKFLFRLVLVFKNILKIHLLNLFAIAI